MRKRSGKEDDEEEVILEGKKRMENYRETEQVCVTKISLIMAFRADLKP